MNPLRLAHQGSTTEVFHLLDAKSVLEPKKASVVCASSTMPPLSLLLYPPEAPGILQEQLPSLII